MRRWLLREIDGDRSEVFEEAELWEMIDGLRLVEHDSPRYQRLADLLEYTLKQVPPRIGRFDGEGVS